MNFKIYRTLLLLFVVNLSFSKDQGQLIISEPEIRILDGSAVVDLKIENAFEQPINAIRAMVVLSDENGKTIGNKSHWLESGDVSETLDFESGESRVFPIKIKTINQAEPAKVNVFITRIVLKDGSKPNLGNSVAKIH